MNVIVFGASGMIGGGAVGECLEDPRIETVLVVGRTGTGLTHPKLRELIHPDLFELKSVADDLAGYDACFYSIGVSAAGLGEAGYRRATLDLTVAVVNLLIGLNPGLKVCFVSGQGTDSSGTSRLMWARVKGEAENALLALPIEAYMFRPGFVQPMKGARSRTRLYRTLYTVVGPLFPVLRRLFPGSVTTTVILGRAMIRAVTDGYPKRILETHDINVLGGLP